VIAALFRLDHQFAVRRGVRGNFVVILLTLEELSPREIWKKISTSFYYPMFREQVEAGNNTPPGGDAPFSNRVIRSCPDRVSMVLVEVCSAYYPARTLSWMMGRATGTRRQDHAHHRR